MPNRFKVVISRTAEKDLIGIYQYIRNGLQNAKAAADLVDKFDEATERIAEFPESCPLCKEEKGYRKLIIDNYIAIYKVNKEKESAIIYRVVYGMMNYDKYI